MPKYILNIDKIPFYNSTFYKLSNHLILAVDGSLHSPPEQCLELIQTISTIPTAYPNSLNTCGRITVHNTGRFVLVSNRGHNSICVLSIEKYSGLLQVYF